MSEELNVNENTENLDEELELDLETEETPADGEETFEKTPREIELERKNKQLFARLKKAEQKDQPKLKSKPTEELQEIREAVNKLSLAEQKRQYQYENNLSPEETDKVFTITPKPTKETLEDPFIKAGLEAIRSNKRVSEATPSPSNRATSHNGKSFADMTAEERTSFMASRRR